MVMTWRRRGQLLGGGGERELSRAPDDLPAENPGIWILQIV